jgi:preprotein translocase subunit YajC
MPTTEQINEYISAMVAAAIASGLEPSDLAAIVTIGGITTKISAANAQIETLQDELDAAVAVKQAAIATVNNAKATLQEQLKQAVGGS